MGTERDIILEIRNIRKQKSLQMTEGDVNKADIEKDIEFAKKGILVSIGDYTVTGVAGYKKFFSWVKDLNAQQGGGQDIPKNSNSVGKEFMAMSSGFFWDAFKDEEALRKWIATLD